MAQNSDPSTATQGELFETVRQYSPVSVTTRFVETPDGHYPETSAPASEDILEDKELLEGVHTAVVFRNRHNGNAHKHSAFNSETGQFDQPEVGDFLPEGFGPVTYRNQKDAIAFVNRLNQKLQASAGASRR